MRFTTLFVAGLALTSTAALAQPGERRFTHDGRTYVYTTAVEKGRKVITGRELPSGETFRLVVAGDRVSGVSGGQTVSFTTAAARGAAGGVTVASN